jgi:hypothetical protein
MKRSARSDAELAEAESTRRLLLAIAISIALHEVFAGLVPAGLTRTTAGREIVTRAQIMRVAVRARPAPTPRPVAVVVQLHPIESATPRSIQAPPGKAAPHVTRSATSVRVASTERSDSKPVWDAVAAGTRTGALAVANGKAGAPSFGSVQNGDGEAAPSGNAPCGFVTFSDPHGSQYDSRTRGFWVDIRMSVRFADGSLQSLILDYPWYYPSEATNPWSDQNLKDPNFPTRFQPPPPEKSAAEPQLVKYVIAHSTPEGLTLLRDCPPPTRSS